MASTLLLVRHGKAKALAEGQDDFDRVLSEAGIRSLNATIAGQLAQFDTTTRSVQVWSSPAARARQTAEIVVAGLGKVGTKPKGDVELHESLLRQDIPAFMEEVRESPADTVVAVGHDPMMETLVAQLANARIPFSTGAVACLKLASPETDGIGFATCNEACHRLLWFSQGPVSQHWKTVVRIEKMMATYADAVSARLQAFVDEPDDIENMHKFRVSIRTTRSLLAFLKPWQDASQNAEMQASLKQVVATTSRLRELDVLCEQAAASTAGSEDLVRFCNGKAADERMRVRDVLMAKKTRKLLEDVRRHAGAIRWKRSVRENGLPASTVRARFDEMAAGLETDLAELDLAEVERTHDVRKKAKRVRYVAENFKDMIGEDCVGIAKGMTAHQDELGAICDARVNIDIINSFESGNIPEPVAWDLALLRAQNETYLYTKLRNRP